METPDAAIAYGSGNAEDTVISARRQSHALRCFGEQRSAVGIGGGDLLEQGPVRFRVGTHVRGIGETLALDLPGLRDAGGYLGAPFGWRR